MTDPAARIQALADRCVLCGLCLPHCPTYSYDRVESESPRGRIALAKGLAEGRLDAASARDWNGIDHCLGCRRCESVCPADVEYGALLVEARRLQRARRPAPPRQRMLEWLTRRPRLLGAAAALLGRLRPLLPRRLRADMPAMPDSPAPGPWHPAIGERRGTVALFLGCVARPLDRPVHHAAIAVLTRLGWDVRVPDGQTCCGALHRHAGNVAAEMQLAATNAAAFSDSPVDAVVVSASGCFESLQQSIGASTPVRELLEFIAGDARLAQWPLRPLGQRIAVHTPCTQATVVAAPGAAERLLQRIPGVDAIAVAGHGCCGAAGNHMLLQPRRAAGIREPLLQQAVETGAPTLCSANIGCRLHLAAGLQRMNNPMQTRHPIELIAEAMT